MRFCVRSRLKNLILLLITTFHFYSFADHGGGSGLIPPDGEGVCTGEDCPVRKLGQGDIISQPAAEEKKEETSADNFVTDEKSAPAMGSISDALLSTPTREMWYLFVKGPAENAKAEKARTDLIIKMGHLVKERNPGAKTFSMPSFQMKYLSNVAKLVDTKQVKSVELVIVFVADSTAEANGFSLRTHEGMVTEQQIATVLKNIGLLMKRQSISFTKGTLNGTSALHTVFLTGNTRAAHCELYPGSVFGVTTASSTDVPELLDKWVTAVDVDRTQYFPVDGFSWQSSFEFPRLLATKGTDLFDRNRSWFCTPPSFTKILGRTTVPSTFSKRSRR